MAEEINREIFLKEWEATKTAVAKEMAGRTSVMKTMGMNGKDFGAVYASAHKAFQAEDYAQAENLFYSLFFMDQTDQKFQTGLAAVFEAQEKFSQALALYALALATGEEDPKLLFRAGKCLMGLDQKAEAKVVFEEAIDCPPFDKAGARAVEQAKNMAALLGN